MNLDPLELGRLQYYSRLLPYARDEHELRSFVAECRLALRALEPPQDAPPAGLNGAGSYTETERQFFARLEAEAAEAERLAKEAAP